MSFEYNRSIGRTGTLLIVSMPFIAIIIYVASFLLGFLQNTYLFSVVFLPLSFSGQILFLVAMNKFANYYDARGIFRNALYAFVIAIAGTFVLFPVTFGALSYLRNLIEANPFTPGTSPAISVIVAIIGFFLILWIGTFLIAAVEGFFYRRAFYALAERSGEHNFKQAGFFMFIGGILMIIAIGALLFFIGWIFAVLGFFSVKPKALQTYSAEETPSS